MPFKSVAQSQWSFRARKPWTKKFSVESGFRRLPGRVRLKTRYAPGRRRAINHYRRRR